jgi:hypothetical protein
MTLSEAKREFLIRDCYWFLSEFEREIKNSFPNLRLFRSGYGWKLYQFMQKLEPPDQLALANAMAKRNPTYLEASGEIMTAEEQALWDSFERTFIEPSSREIEIRARNQAGEKVKMASKRKLRKEAVAKFVAAFGAQCFDMKLGEEWDPLFQMKCCGWIVSTQLTFGRRQPVIAYRHMIVSETRIAHPRNPQITGPAMTLAPGVTWLVNQWEDIVDEEADAACNALVRQVGYFFEVAPKLLAGLEFDKIVP